MPNWMKLSLQDASTSIMEQMIIFHDHVMMIIIVITITVMYMLTSMMFNNYTNRYLLESQMMEMIWTIIPAFILVMITLPSLRILYLIEEINKPLLTIKAIGHQWYWTYEYTDLMKMEMESYMKPTEELTKNEMRLLETDNRIILPYNISIRLLTTSTDVIHSWTIPSMGIKIDSTPGRINQGSIMINRPGIYTGQCSEICGANHSFMHITIESINKKMFLKWIKNF